MPRELSDAELAAWQEDRNIANAARSIWDDPKLGPEARALLKKKNPGMQIPDYDIRTEMRDGFAAMEQRMQAERDAEKQKREDDHWQGERARVKKEHNLNDDELKDLEKMMLEKNIGDYDVAATYRASKMPKPSDPLSSGYKDPYWNHGKSDTFREIAKDPEEWGRSEIIRAINNDQNRQRGGF